jgi:hypothetical protein
MPLLTLDEAAVRLGTSRETIDQWIRSGVLSVHQRPQPNGSPDGVIGTARLEPCVDEDELFDKADSMGWLMLSAEAWDRTEDE